ncbi:MAG: DUF3553 domain-containing protein, partial [Lachnospiraceae bacterium]|nr:DUF3553 domain-containing protein [Lachnospiraceae bacterium]
SGDREDYSGFKRTADVEAPYNPYSSKPRAYYSSKKTPEEEKPFISKAMSLNSLKKGSDLAPSGGNIKAGDRVRHIKFGEGTVISVVKEPRDDKITVQFDTAGQRVMYASFAKLQKL